MQVLGGLWIEKMSRQVCMVLPIFCLVITIQAHASEMVLCLVSINNYCQCSMSCHIHYGQTCKTHKHATNPNKLPPADTYKMGM